MYITTHAKERLKERCGLPKRAIERNAQKALSKGVCHSECTGRLRKYLDYLFLSHKNGTNIKLYGNHVYLFSGARLITVFVIPHAHKDAFNKIMKRKKEAKSTDDLAHKDDSENLVLESSGNNEKFSGI